MVSKFFYIPLTIIVFISILGLSGLQSGLSLGSASGYGFPVGTVFYDVGGNPKVYENLTAVNEKGSITSIAIDGIAYAYWNNFSLIQYKVQDPYNPYNRYQPFNYPLYKNNDGTSPLTMDEIQPAINGLGNNFNFSISTSLGLIAIAVALMAVGAIIGFHVLGSGENDTSIAYILKTTGFLVLWAVFSVIPLILFGLIPMGLGYIVYFILTIIYVIGLIDSIGFPTSSK